MKTNYRLLLIVLLTISGSAYADLYKWVDEQGRVHYGDKPKSMNNAEQMKLQKQKKTSSQPAKTAKSKTAYSSETSRQTEQAYHSDEMKRLSNLPPGEFQQQLQEMEKKRRQAILNTEHEAAVDYEQRQQSWKEKQERNG